MFIRRLIDGLSQAGVRYCVVGGVAMNLHGVPRMTYDIDIAVELSAANMAATRRVLEALGLRCRLPITLEELADAERRDQLASERNLLAVTFTDPSNPLHEVDVLVGGGADLQQIVARAVVVGSAELQVRVAAVSDLIAMKELAGRDQDLADVVHLRRCQGDRDG